MTIIRFRTGATQKFPGAGEAAREAGYPDVPTYLRSTGQIDQWCEEVPQDEVDQMEFADQFRAENHRKLIRG